MIREKAIPYQWKALNDQVEGAEAELLNGVVTVKTPAFRIDKDAWNDRELYSASAVCPLEPVELKWIPYYAWANRGRGEMYVWIHRT